MRVLLTADTLGGVFTYTVELCRGLAAHGVQVLVATMGELPSPAQRAALAACGNVRLFPSRFKLEWQEEPWEDVGAAGSWLLDLEATWAPGVVQLCSYAHAQLPFAAPKVMVAHSCVASRHEAVHGMPLPGRWRRYRHEAALGLRKATRVVAVSHAMEDALRRHYEGVGRVDVIPNGRTARAVEAVPRREAIFSAGRTGDEAKNLALLEQVAPRLPWPVKVAGASAGPPGATPNLARLGQLDEPEVWRHMASAGIYCLPARYEPFGLSVLEAALSGCALVLGDIPALRENWDGAAAFVPPGDAGALERVLVSLCGDAPARASLAIAARERAQAFGTARMAGAYAALYRELQGRAVTCASSSSPTRFARTGTTAAPTS